MGRKNWLYPFALLVSVLPLATIPLWRLGAGADCLIFPMHAAFFFLTLFSAKRWWQIIVPGPIHIAATYCAIMQTGWLWYANHPWDKEGVLVTNFAGLVGVLISSGVFIALLVILGIRRKRERMCTKRRGAPFEGELSPKVTEG